MLIVGVVLETKNYTGWTKCRVRLYVPADTFFIDDAHCDIYIEQKSSTNNQSQLNSLSENYQNFLNAEVIESNGMRISPRCI